MESKYGKLVERKTKDGKRFNVRINVEGFKKISKNNQTSEAFMKEMEKIDRQLTKKDISYSLVFGLLDIMGKDHVIRFCTTLKKWEIYDAEGQNELFSGKAGNDILLKINQFSKGKKV